MKAILIDVASQCLQMVNIGIYMPEVYEIMHCNHITAVYPLPFAFTSDIFYVDDQALQKPFKEIKGAFFLGEPRQPIFGNALLVGCDRKGQRTEPLITLAQLSAKIRFLDSQEVVLYHTLMEKAPPKIYYW
jgi:hypothetical protein